MNYILFTDIVGSTKLAKEKPDVARQVQNNLFEATRKGTQDHGGKILQYTGDGYLCSFQTALGALKAGAMMIAANSDTSIRVAVHYSEQLDPHTFGQERDFSDQEFDDIRDWANQAIKFGTGYTPVAFTARLLGATKPNQILASEQVQFFSKDNGQWKEYDPILLKDFDEQPEPVYGWLYDGDCKGQPSNRYLPDWYHGEVNRYVHRESIEQKMRHSFKAVREKRATERVFVLFGEGGTGKTRLAYEAVSKVSGFYQRSFFIRLATAGPVNDDSFMDGNRELSESERTQMVDAFLDTFTRELGVQEAFIEFKKSGQPNHQAMCSAIRSQLSSASLTVIVLDNWESIHCLETQDLLMTLATQFDSWQFVVTSRTKPLIQGASHIENINEGLTKEEAIGLFVSRWTNYGGNSNEKIDRSLVADLVEECAYWPLAIELAATAKANDPSISVNQVLNGIRELPLQTFDAGDVSMVQTIEDKRRHQSLQRSLQYSFNLLPKDLKIAVVQCSLFEEDWTREAMQAVLKNPAVIGKLQNHSRIQYRDEIGKFSMHRVAREFYRRKSVDFHFEFETATDRFNNFYRELLDQETPRIGREGGTEPVDRLNREGTLNWVKVILDDKNWSEVDRMTYIRSIGFRWQSVKNHQSALAQLSAVSGLVGADGFSNVGDLHYRLGENDLALVAWEKAESLYFQSGDPQGQANVLSRRGDLHYRLGENSLALVAWEKAESLYVQSGDPQGQANVLSRRGDLYYRLGENSLALVAWEKAESLYVKSGDPLGRANVLSSRGDLHFLIGESDLALAAWEMAESLYFQSGDPQGQANVLSRRGDLYYRLGENSLALVAWEKAESLYVQSGDPLGRANVLSSRGDLYYRLGENDLALVAWDKAESLYVKSGDPLGQANVQLVRAKYFKAQGELDQFQNAKEKGLALLRKIGMMDYADAWESELGE